MWPMKRFRMLFGPLHAGIEPDIGREFVHARPTQFRTSLTDI